MGSSLKDFNLVYQNIRSMRRNTDKLLAHIEAANVKPLLIGLSEIWIYNEEVRNYSLDGYNLFAKCNTNYRSGGVAIYARKDLNCRLINIESRTFDGIGISFYLCSRLVCAICIYRFNFSNISDFIDEFAKLLNDFPQSNLIVMGDFNIDFLQTNTGLDNLLVMLSNNGLDILISEPTRITDYSATCIDNVLYRLDQRYFHNISSSVLDVGISDHCLVEAKFCAPPLRTPIKRIVDIPRIDYVLLKELLLCEEWSDVYSQSNASVAYDVFIYVLKGHLSRCTTYVSLKGKSTKLKPWMSDQLLNQIRKRNKICQLAKKHQNNARLANYSRKLSEKVNSNILLNKKQFYTQQFKKNGNNARKNWKTVNNIINDHPESVDVKEITGLKGDTITDSVAIANELNDFFVSMGASNVSSVDMDVLEKNRIITEDYNIINSFHFSAISPGELYTIINSLKSKSSPGIDEVSNCVVKKIACFIVDVLSFIMNLSVQTGVFPQSLKSAVVIPIYKKNDRTCLNNYRPISLLSIFSKIFEKVVKGRMVCFMEKYDFLSPMQFGFRKHKNTEQAISTFLERISADIDQGFKTSALYIDLTKAFDRVDHNTLLRKLYCCGFRGTFYKWLCSYLCGRTQVVRVNHRISRELSIRVGVPQGSVLGPLLFLVYVNGIFCQQFCGSVTGFADDFSFAYSGLTKLNNITNIVHDLNLLARWLKAHNLLLSDKTKLQHFRDSQALPCVTIYHMFGCSGGPACISNGCFEIKEAKEIRYLGVIIDANLNWKAHIEGLKSKLLLVARKMYALRLYCPLYLRRLIYFALVDSALLYGLTCWGGACSTVIAPLYIRQKHILRLITFQDRLSPSWPIFRELDILPLRHMYVFKVLKIFYIISGNNFVNYPDYNLRLNSKYRKHIPNFKLEFRRRFFIVASPIIFNNLPITIRMCGSFSVFTKTLKQYLSQTSDIEQLFSLLV